MTEMTPGEFIAICRTAGCGNADHPIHISAEGPDPVIMCGPCAQRILDVTPVSSA